MAIEVEVDDVVRAQLMKSTASDDGSPEISALMSVAHRLDNLIHHRRTVLAARAPEALGS
jgi:hypothetical protein